MIEHLVEVVEHNWVEAAKTVFETYRRGLRIWGTDLWTNEDKIDIVEMVTKGLKGPKALNARELQVLFFGPGQEREAFCPVPGEIIWTWVKPRFVLREVSEEAGYREMIVPTLGTLNYDISSYFRVKGAHSPVSLTLLPDRSDLWPGIPLRVLVGDGLKEPED